METTPVNDEYGNTIDLNGAVVSVVCFPGGRRANVAITHPVEQPPHLRGALLDRPRVESLIESLQCALRRMPDAS